ncbi:MAG: hypothetical protein AMXMBFR56_79830 [Polyangiaceae bacterium]|jgi:hypothetical protein
MIRSGALALALVLLTGVAQAQPADVAKADTLFKEGRALMKSGNFETACPKLEESYRLDPAAGTGINLGDCFEKQGKVASALLAYQAARALLKPGDPRIGPVEKEIAALNKRTPRLTIKLAPGAPEGTTVTRDGREVEASKLGVPVAVNPGKLKVVVSAPRREQAVFRVTLAEGTSRALEVGPGEETSGLLPTGRAPSARSRSGPQSNETTDGSSQRTAGWITVGIGAAAGLLGGGYFLAKALSVPDECTTDCNALNDEEQGYRDNATRFGVGGSILAGVGLALVLAAPSDARAPSAARIAPRVQGRMWVLGAGGTW